MKKPGDSSWGPVVLPISSGYGDAGGKVKTCESLYAAHIVDSTLPLTTRNDTTKCISR